MKNKSLCFVAILAVMLLALCGTALANSWGLTGDLYRAVESSGAWGDYSTLSNQEGSFAVMHSKDHNALFYLDGENTLHVYPAAVYQPEDGRGAPELSWDGMYLVISYQDKEIPEYYTFADFDLTGEYRFAEALIGEDYMVDGYEGQFVAGNQDDFAWREADLSLASFNIRLFPRSLEEVRHLNEMDAQFAGFNRCLGFEEGTGESFNADHPGTLLQPGQKGTAPVYSAPFGDAAWRAANGKAAVGLDGDLWLLSRYLNADGDSYACIRYNVSEKTQRIGYVRCADVGVDAVEDWENGPGYAFARVEVEAIADTYLTDDPDGSQAARLQVPKGTQFTGLGLYNDAYAYVSAEVKDGAFTDGGAIIWGFVPIRDLWRAEVPLDQEVMDPIVGDWILEYGGCMAGERLYFQRDGSFAAITGMVEDGYEPGETDCAKGDWSVTAYNPNMNLYWNDPTYVLTLRYYDGRVQMLGLLIGEDELILSDWEALGTFIPQTDEQDMGLEAFRQKWGMEGDDLYNWFLALVREKGDFDRWPTEDQVWFNTLLDDVSDSPTLRVLFELPGWIDRNSVVYDITQWRYALPGQDELTREEAIDKALLMLRERYDYGDQVESWTCGASYYTGHWMIEEFAEPWWVIRFYDQQGMRTAVWVNARTGAAPLHDTAAVIGAAREAIEASDPADTGYEADPELLQDETLATALYQAEDETWTVLWEIDPSARWEVLISDQTLEAEDAGSSNG